MDLFWIFIVIKPCASTINHIEYNDLHIFIIFLMNKAYYIKFKINYLLRIALMYYELRRIPGNQIILSFIHFLFCYTKYQKYSRAYII